MRTPSVVHSIAAAVAVALATGPRAEASMCGCDKVPPPHAVVRPAFEAPGWQITLFSPNFVPGRAYEVSFLSRVSDRNSRLRSTRALATAVLAKDQADFKFDELNLPPDRRTPIAPKPQLRVVVPKNERPGPHALMVVDAVTRGIVLDLPETEFLVVGEPVQLLPDRTLSRSYLTAVDAGGYLYFALDMSLIQD